MATANPQINHFIPRRTEHPVTTCASGQNWKFFVKILMEVMGKTSRESKESAIKHHPSAFPSKIAQKIAQK
ncbi:hypothetical protein NG791_04425 [Laspinema sp. D1]|uniref:hypothetical protein n=1 Tax=Laspinema palackyanum TaxID=3231601 RepID=UPI003489690D|nr:hypothetical protein [Laspinema sp. D2b]